MILPLPYYLIPQVFSNLKATEYSNMDTGNIVADANKCLKANGVQLDDILYGMGWQEERGMIDLELSCDEEFKEAYGSFYITWFEKYGWECKSVWFNGRDANDNEVHEEWDNK